MLLLFLCCSSAVFQSDPLTLVQPANGSLKVVYFTPNTSGVSVCVVWRCVRGRRGTLHCHCVVWRCVRKEEREGCCEVSWAAARL